MYLNKIVEQGYNHSYRCSTLQDFPYCGKHGCEQESYKTMGYMEQSAGVG